MRPIFITRLLFAPLYLAALTAISARAAFTLTGSFPDIGNPAELTLTRENLEDGSSTAVGEVSLESDRTFEASFELGPGLYTLHLPDGAKVPLAIDNDQVISIRPDPDERGAFAIEGSPDTMLLQAYEAFRKDSLIRLVYPPRARLNRAKEADQSPETLAPLAAEEVAGYTAHRRELNDFTIERVGPSMALYATSLRWDPDHRLDELEALVDAFSNKHPDLDLTHRLQTKLQAFKRTAIGAKAAPLSGKSLDGSTHSLDDFAGKVVLVDFWASWCVPCRVENRHYHSLLNQYADEGFAIFAVNLDESRVMWGNASDQDRVSWPQISDLSAWDSPLAKAYNVSALPMSFLLDRNGRIIGRNLRGDQLSKKLKELFAP